VESAYQKGRADERRRIRDRVRRWRLGELTSLDEALDGDHD
jgi:hypothetical protein